MIMQDTRCCSSQHARNPQALTFLYEELHNNATAATNTNVAYYMGLKHYGVFQKLHISLFEEVLYLQGLLVVRDFPDHIVCMRQSHI